MVALAWPPPPFGAGDKGALASPSLRPALLVYKQLFTYDCLILPSTPHQCPGLTGFWGPALPSATCLSHTRHTVWSASHVLLPSNELPEHQSLPRFPKPSTTAVPQKQNEKPTGSSHSFIHSLVVPARTTRISDLSGTHFYSSLP